LDGFKHDYSVSGKKEICFNLEKSTNEKLLKLWVDGSTKFRHKLLRSIVSKHNESKAKHFSVDHLVPSKLTARTPAKNLHILLYVKKVTTVKKTQQLIPGNGSAIYCVVVPNYVYRKL